MERRKVQIRNKVDEIIEEKDLMQFYLDKIMNQVHSCLELINSPKKLDQKDYTLILKYELEILKKITAISYELESVLDESPLHHLETGCVNDSSIRIKPIQNVVVDKPNITAKTELGNLNIVEMQEPIELAQSLEYRNLDIVETQEPVELAESLQYRNIMSTIQSSEVNSECESDKEKDVKGNLSDEEIQNLRETLKRFSEKLALNPKCCSLYSTDSGNNDKYEIPVKDTPIGMDSDAFEKKDFEKVYNIDESSSADANAMNTSLGQIFEKNDLEKIYGIDEDCSEDANTANITESSSNDESVMDEAPNCLIPILDEHSVIIDHFVNHPKTDSSVESINSTYCTALEKLNNMKVVDRQAEAVAKMQTVNQPDISLKPTEHRIRNNLEPSDKKSKKQKKNKTKQTEFYELVPKATPQKGALCAFSHIESPNEFYIHLVDEESTQIDSITEQLNATFLGTVSDYVSKEEAHNAIGTFCVAFVIIYNSWYRAQVLSWELESKSDDVLVQFVDFGDKRRISYRNLRRVTKEMTEIPMLAVRCHLSLMYPPNSTRDNKLTEWPLATIEAMMDLSGMLDHRDGGREKIFSIVYSNQEGRSLSVDMYHCQDDEENTVGQILLNLGLAEQVIEEHDGEHFELEQFLQDVDNLERADNINEAVMGYDPRDEMRICRFTKGDGTCYKGKNCKLEHVPLSKDGFTTDKMLIFHEAMYSLTLPKPGEYVNILVTGYKDVCNFFLQVILKPHNEKGYMIDADLYSLLADMNHAKTIRTYEAFKIPPALGEIVIVKHCSNKFLRAKVREKIAESDDGSAQFQVFTVDFGEYMTVPMESLRKIKPHFLELPFQAVECYLHNFVAREDGDKRKAKKFFCDNMYYRNFVAEVMSNSLPMRVAVTTFDRRDIGLMLAKEGLVEPRVCDLNPPEGCYLELY